MRVRAGGEQGGEQGGSMGGAGEEKGESGRGRAEGGEGGNCVIEVYRVMELKIILTEYQQQNNTLQTGHHISTPGLRS